MDDAYAIIATDHWVLLPVVLRHHPWDPYCEPNDHWLDAFGPLPSARIFKAYPDDLNDYYYFTLSDQRTVEVVVSNYEPTSFNGNLLVYGPADGDQRGPLVDHFGDADYHTVMQLSLADLAPGKYYVLVLTSDDESDTELYTLQVTY